MKKTINKRRLLSLTLALSMTAGMSVRGFAAEGDSTDEIKSVTISATAAYGDCFIVNERELTVSSNEAESYGYTDTLTDGVSALDVLVKMHEITFDDFTAETATGYFDAPGGWITCVFGEETGNVGYKINHADALGLSDTVTDGGAFELFFYQDLQYWSDVYVHLNDINAIAGEETVINASNNGTPLEGVQLAKVDGLNIYPIDRAVADENGYIKVTFDKPGTYYVTLTGTFSNMVTDWGTGSAVQFDSPVVPSVTKVTVLSIPDNFNDAYAATTETIGNIELKYGKEWAAMGLARSGIKVPDTYYESVMDAVRNNKLTSATDYERTIIALTSTGRRVDALILEKLSSATYVKNGGLMSSIYALIALDSAAYEIPQSTDAADQNTRDIMIADILTYQKEDGGFSFSQKWDATVDTTAIAVEALAKYTDKDEVRESIEKALTFIDSKIYVDDPYSPDKCSTLAQVIVAYTELGKDSSDYVNKMVEDYYDGNGQFLYNDKANESTTIQAYYALVSYYRWARGENSLYNMSDAFYDIVSYDGNKCVIYSPFAGKVAVTGAAYTEGVMTSVKSEETELKKGRNNVSIDGAEKIMLWNSLDSMQPLCEVYKR